MLGAAIAMASCTHKNTTTDTAAETMAELADSLQAIADSCPGEMGIALITDRGDTLTINNQAKYPMMSVFKLHQAIALCHTLREGRHTPDSIVTLNRSELNPDTWSPMLADHKEAEIRLPISTLLSYTIRQSDNNASNYMFTHLQNVAVADSLIATLIPAKVSAWSSARKICGAITHSATATSLRRWEPHCWWNDCLPTGLSSIQPTGK